MPDVFTKQKRSEVMSRIRGRPSEAPEVKVVAANAEVFDNVGDDSAWNVAGMPGEGDEAVGTEGIGIMAVTAGGAEELTADFAETAVELAAIPGGIFAHR